MKSMQPNSNFWQERRQRQQQQRHRRQMAMFRWFGAVLMVGIGTGLATLLHAQFAMIPVPRIGSVWGVSLVGALAGGIIGFVSCYSLDVPTLFAVAAGHDPVSPRFAAWWIGMPASVAGATLAATVTVSNAGNGWVTAVWAFLDGISGWAAWWSVARIVRVARAGVSADETNMKNAGES